MRSTIARASGSLSGGRPMARSATSSTEVPPAPNSTTGPNVGSMLPPTMSSWVCARRTIACTVKPSMTASGRAADTRLSIDAAACRTAAPSEQVEHHAAHVGLVVDVGGQHLEHDRVADGVGGRLHHVRIGQHAPGGDDGDAVEGQQCLRLGFGAGTSRPADSAARSSRAVAVDVGPRGTRGRRAAPPSAGPGCGGSARPSRTPAPPPPG